MIGLLNAALVELQSAALARALYPVGHPRIRAGEERALAMLGNALSERPEVTVFAVGERVVFNDTVLPSSASLVNTLFALLRKRGADRITFRVGLGAKELHELLDALTSGLEDPPPLEETAHVSFGAISRDNRVSPAVAVKAEDLAMAAEAATALGSVWRGVRESRTLDGDILGDIVSTMGRAISDTSCTLLPLAFVKSHDEYTFVHIINVGILTMSLGEALGFDKRMTHELGVAALLHDVGKMAVPLEVLNKNGRFTDEEYKAMQVHPVEGARMLLRTPGVSDLAAVVAYEHHVRYDGGGYPKVPAGWKLGLASRICQVADVYDALRTDRPYRAGMPEEKIVKIMKSDAGTYFDPDLLSVFLERVVPRAVLRGPGAVGGTTAREPAPAEAGTKPA